MSSENVKAQIRIIRENMSRSYFYYNVTSEISVDFLKDVNLLQQSYGEFLGNVKARHQEYSKELSNLDNNITTCFVKLTQFSEYKTAFHVVNVTIGKISELVSFVETIESAPPEDRVSKASYDKLLREKEEAENTAKFLVQYRGLPELNTLIENANSVGIAVDEHWVLALCSSNLIEAVVNKKLEKLGEKAEGSFRERYRKLCTAIKEKEKRELQQLLPLALYEGVRNKLDHASDSNRVTPKEAKDISRMVIEFMKEVFQKIS